MLNGEVDKSAHPIFSKLGANRRKPDFLVLTPGAMSGNHAIIEVKHSTAHRGIRKDIETLNLFVKHGGYKRAIYLIYGKQEGEKSIEKIKEVSRQFPNLYQLKSGCSLQFVGKLFIK